MRLVIAILTALLVVCASTAQSKKIKDIEKRMPPIKLVTKVDDKRLKQWDKTPQRNCPACKGSKTEKCQHCRIHENPEKCPECKVTRKAPCHYCAGKGELFDELKWTLCPGCHGHSLFNCFMCSNRGRVRFSSGGKRPSKCGMCKGEAGLACIVCKGKRLVPSAFGGKVGKTKLKKLKKAKQDLTKLIASLQKFHSLGNPRKDRKTFKELFKGLQRGFPPLKKTLEQVEFVSKSLDQHIKDIERRQAQAFEWAIDYILYYAVHQSKVIDLCIARLEFNENPAKAAK